MARWHGRALLRQGRRRTLSFFPYGWHRPSYYLEASDENKIKAVVTIYFVASALVNIVGSTACIAVTQALIIDEHAGPLRRKLEFGSIVYAISATFLYVLPALLLWKTYRGLLAGLCSSLATVGPDSIRQMQPPSSKQRTAVVLFVLMGSLLLILGVVVAISCRP